MQLHIVQATYLGSQPIMQLASHLRANQQGSQHALPPVSLKASYVACPIIMHSTKLAN